MGGVGDLRFLSVSQELKSFRKLGHETKDEDQLAQDLDEVLSLAVQLLQISEETYNSRRAGGGDVTPSP